MLLAASSSFCQLKETLGSDKNNYNGRVKKAFRRSPVLLVDALTANKNTDREKFEAIYNWVVKNIDYDYEGYFSCGAVGSADLQRILKRRRGVCLDYTFLMDTLCSLAGITNVSIYGYAKDELFDVNDSIYVDNHAWNAVQLDNLWYLYDVTWSKGITRFRYTKFSRFIIDLKKKLTVKLVPKVIRQKRKKYFRKTECGGYLAVDSAEHNVTIYKPVYRHRLLRKILSMFRLKIIRTYEEHPNSNFYMADPAVFGITHYPDDPDWSMLPEKMKIRDFECDSAFYHLTADTYILQEKRGSSCSNCLGDHTMEPLPENEHMLKQSLGCNPRNRFMPSLCQYHIGQLKLNESKNHEDSLTKVALLDTSQAFAQRSRGNVLQAMHNTLTDEYLLSLKNRRKMGLLSEENKRHNEFVRNKMEASFQETKNIRDLESKLNMYASRLFYRNRTINNYTQGREIERSAAHVQSSVNYINEALALKMRKTDSLNAMILKVKTDYDTTLPRLNVRLWNKVFSHDSLLRPLKTSIYYRYKEMLDDYKKKIVETKKQLTQLEKKYAAEVDSTIYKPAEFCYETALRVFLLIEERNRLSYDCYKLKCQLVKFNETEPRELDVYRESLLSENKDDLCWLKGKDKGLQSIFYGFKALLDRQKAFAALLIDESNFDLRRYYIVEREIRRRGIRYRRILAHNAIAVTFLGHQITINKNRFLNQLRKERRLAAKQSKN